MIYSELLKQQQELQIESKEILTELKLNDLLSPVGEPVQVGSSALGLMVWRDIDITVVCSELNINAIAQIASKLITYKGMREVKFINDSGIFNNSSDYPDGLYLGLKYKSLKGMDWKLDIWFVDQPEKQPDLMHIKIIPEQLTPELRESILTIKSIWVMKDEYGKTVRSYDIYTAVLYDNVRTPYQFQEWLRSKSKI
ncbi:hypothetical protein AAGC94_17820 [Clostridium sporogenes]|uniref:hypothetical protein n=1 Tax=Clostridium TaxID=1485 RepID=UPI0006B49748|nr:hypothetical protein [Clostridium cochlearium]MDU1443015.1 hypothetical protein [Clostridium cochlearium]DAF07680.1 MAG TPA: hypothetical protein [Bacteriophage sp.]